MGPSQTTWTLYPFMICSTDVIWFIREMKNCFKIGRMTVLIHWAIKKSLFGQFPLDLAHNWFYSTWSYVKLNIWTKVSQKNKETKVIHIAWSSRIAYMHPAVGTMKFGFSVVNGYRLDFRSSALEVERDTTGLHETEDFT